MSDDEVMALVRMLCRYLRDNPLACDAPAGIARWWLAGEADALVREEPLLRALQWMESRRLIERIEAADGRVRFRRAPDDSDFESRCSEALLGQPGWGDRRDGAAPGDRVH